MKTIYQNRRIITIKIITIIALLFFTVVQAKASCNINPNFIYSQNGNDLIFTALHPEGNFTRYNWSFNDNSSGFGKVETHTFQRAGNYTVSLYVSDSVGNYCDTFSTQIITIANSLPCNIVNDTIIDTLYLSNNLNDNNRTFCLINPFCFETAYYLGLNNTVHGSISGNFGCISYSYNSIGIDTFTVFQCDTGLGICKSTFFNINILSSSSCDLINQDTIRLRLDTLFNGYYNLSNLYDSINMVQRPFVLEEWTSINNTLTPNRSFDSIVQLFRYMDSVASGIFEYGDGNFYIYSDTPNSQQYNNGIGLKLFIPSLLTTFQYSFQFSQTTNAQYCSSLQNDRRYWFDQGSQYQDFCTPDNMGFNFSQNGIYDIIIRDSISNCIDKIVFVVGNSLLLCDTITCLLPGDADHDLTVNNYDVLAIGLSYNRTGVARTNATTQYTLQACDDWNTTHYYGYNDKFADCNGDGRINSSDALVINQNYIVQAQNHFNYRQSQLDSLPSVTLTFDTLPTMVINGNCDGAELMADINVGSADQPLVNGYGIAFSVNYPFDNDTCFSVTVDLNPNSWFQTNNPVLLFYKNIPQYKRVDVSVVRTDGLQRTGNGRIGRIKMITEGGIFRGGRLSSNKVFDFSVTDVAAINQIGQRINVNGSSTTVNFVVAGVKQNKVSGLKIYPNPTNSKLFIQAKENITSIKIIDLFGRIIDEFMPDKNDVDLDFSSTENGMYIIEIKGENSVSYEKIFKQ